MNIETSLPVECEHCLLRQFDDDVVSADTIPEDVQQHLLACSRCHESWYADKALDAKIYRSVQDEVPSGLYRRAYISAVEIEDEQVQKHWTWMTALNWIARGLAASVACYLVLSLSEWAVNPNWIAFAVGLSVSGLGYAWDQLFDVGNQTQPESVR